MAMYPKTTGQAVTTRIKTATQDDDGRMKLDKQLKEMMDILHPVGEVKFLMSDQIAAWITEMARYSQTWTGIDGRLLKCTDYPELFALIGYKYGYSNTNPNGTYTYTFTDNDGNEKSLIIYNDLDIDGNAKPVPEGESPLYFRLPNLSGRFLRCAGTASYVNKWTDTDGTVRQLLTEYKAEMYKGHLDAQRGIYGSTWINRTNGEHYTGVFFARYDEDVHSGYYQEGFGKTLCLDSSRVAPIANEMLPASMPVSYFIRIA